MKKYDVKLYNVDLSIVCFFDKGCDDTIAFRSELDGLPIKENSEHLIKSVNGNMHACGHDIHTSALLKLAKYINENKFKNNICLIFQSQEESGAGSLRIVNSGLFEELKIKEIIGMHVWPNLGYNKVFSNENLMFGSYELDVIIKGENNHVSTYNQSKDATYASYLVFEKLYKINDEYISHLGEIHSGNLRNISSDKAVMKYTIRFKKDSNIKEEIMSNKIDTKCSVEYHFKNYYPILNNDLELLKKVNYNKIDTLKSAEDFGYYSRKCKSLYLLFGLGKGFNLHTSNFDTNEKTRKLYYNKLLEILNIYKK